MISFRRKGPDRLDIAAQFVCHDDTRFVKAGDQPGKETPGSFGIAARLHKDIEHIAVCIHRAERETMIGPDGIGHDFAGETIAFQARHLC